MRRNLAYVLLFALTILMVLALLAPFSIVFVETGHGGVLWRRFEGGTAFRPALGEGFHFILPWNRLTIYDLRLQYWENRLEVLTGDGLPVSLDVSVRYRLSPSNLAFLHQAVGPDYIAKVIEPQVGAVVRELVADYPTTALLGTARNDIRRNIYRDLTDRSRLNLLGVIDPVTGSDAIDPVTTPLFQASGSASSWGQVNSQTNTLNRPLILLQDFLISRVAIPDRLRSAIEAKLEQGQVAAAYEYRLTAERLEAERKFVEAEGIRRFQEVVSKSLTPSYLTYLGVQATELLSRSNNAKTIIIGGQNGLPVILNTGDFARSSGPETLAAAPPNAGSQGAAPSVPFPTEPGIVPTPPPPSSTPPMPPPPLLPGRGALP